MFFTQFGILSTANHRESGSEEIPAGVLRPHPLLTYPVNNSAHKGNTRAESVTTVLK